MRKFSVSDRTPEEVCPPVHRYVVGVDTWGDGDWRALLQHRGNGQTFFMTYRTERRARQALAEARARGFTSAGVVDCHRSLVGSGS